MTTLRSFVDRVQSEMKARGKIPADIARTGIVTDAAVSKLFSLQQKSVGYKMVLAISTALEMPESTVRKWAGYEKDISGTHNELTEEASYLFDQIETEEGKRSALAMLRALAELKKRNGRKTSGEASEA